MKKTAALLLSLLLLLPGSSALAAKARGIRTDAQSDYHAQHLLNHVASGDLTCTGNYVRVRTTPGGSKVAGHLEQADGFMLLDVQNGYAQIEVIWADKASPDSFSGMTGWVSSDYIDCGCPQVLYESFERGVEGTPCEPPAQLFGQWSHLSGAGAWSTELVISPDGAFSGYFHDSEMGESGEGYPYGTVYECRFSGCFSSFERIDDTTHVMTCDQLSIEGLPGSESITDGVRSVISDPAGLSLYNTFVLYLPDTPTAEMTESQLIWMHVNPGKTLGVPFLYNLTQDRGFMPE